MMAVEMGIHVVHNAEEQRYELWVDEALAGVLEYESAPGVLVLAHAEIDPALEGRGLGTRLAADAFQDIRSRGLKLIPACSFVRAYLRRHPEERDVVLRSDTEPSS